MLEYGEAFLSSNEEALEKLAKILSPAAFRVAIEMSPHAESDDMSGITIDKYVKRAGNYVLASSLEPDDPDHPYNQALSQGVIPEEYGIEHPRNDQFKDMSRGELIEEILSLRKMNHGL